MTLLILGLALWWASHLYPIYLPARRAAAHRRLGEKLYKSAFSMFSVIAVAFIVMGYQKAGLIAVWTPPLWTTHLNNLLMLVAIFLFITKFAKSGVRRQIRHPMLAGVKVWAVAHLLVNGDLASIVLFGGLLAWAVVAMIGSSRRDGAWQRPAGGGIAGLIRHGVIAVVVFLAIVGVHGLLFGVSTFPR